MHLTAETILVTSVRVLKILYTLFLCDGESFTSVVRDRVVVDGLYCDGQWLNLMYPLHVNQADFLCGYFQQLLTVQDRLLFHNALDATVCKFVFPLYLQTVDRDNSLLSACSAVWMWHNTESNESASNVYATM